MKTKLCYLLVLLMAPFVQIHADESIVALVVSLTDGTEQSYLSIDQPKVTMDETMVFIKSDLIEVEIPASQVVRFYFDWPSSPTAIDEVATDSKFYYDGHSLELAGAGDVVMVYDMSGRLLRKAQTIDGSLLLDMSSMESGIYLIKTKTQTIKILKK